jgi:hypothetical protein
MLWFYFFLPKIRGKNVPCHRPLFGRLWSQPLDIKIDTGTGYISTAFKAFCSPYQILHVTGIPYNHQGQAIVKQAYYTFKLQLQQKWRDSSLATQIKALFTLNFFNCSESGLTPAEKHWDNFQKKQLSQVLWKDMMTGGWHSPNPVLMWGRGHACVFPEDVENTIWMPSRFVKTLGACGPTDEKASSDE